MTWDALLMWPEWFAAMAIVCLASLQVGRELGQKIARRFTGKGGKA